MKRTAFTILLAGLFILALSMTGFAQNNTEQGLSKFALGGTAKTTKPMNHVISMSVSASGDFGYASRTLDNKINDLTNSISLDFYFVAPRSCGGGSPRIQLSIDKDGDGVVDGRAFGYVGPPPNYTNCASGTWSTVQLADLPA